MRAAVMVLLGILAGCGADRPPPANQSFAGLPVAGDRAFAEALGFGQCVKTATALRCFKEGVMLEGEGPYRAAVDLAGRDGREGFTQLTLWTMTTSARYMPLAPRWRPKDGSSAAPAPKTAATRKSGRKPVLPPASRST